MVTALRGQALVARPLAPQPLSLKFKDDVFVRDRVETRQDSLVRVLLGGRALVTVRELSTFTATEGPNQVVIDLRTGKAAVGVVPSLLRPGETIEVKTPNAVAGIRGSLLVVTVFQVGSDVRTTFEAPRASKPITVSALGMPTVSVDLNANQSVDVTGMGALTRVGPVTDMTAAQAAAAARTADAPRPREQEASSPMAPGIAAASIAEAVQLVVALQGAPAPDPLFQEETIDTAQGGGAIGNLASSITATSQLQVDTFVANQALATQENQPLPPSPPTPPPLCAGCVVIENQTLGLPPGQSTITFAGTSTWPPTIPVVRIDQSTVSGDSTFVEAAPGSAATFAAPLLLVTNSTIETGGNVVHVGSARLDAAPIPALLSFDASSVNAGTGVIRLDGGASLGVQGSLLTAQSTSLRPGDPTSNTSPFLGIFDGSSLEQTGASGAPLLVFDASPVNSAGALISVQGSPSTGNPSRLALDGPLFRAVNGTQLTLSGDALGISDGGQFTGGSASGALIELDNAQLTTGPSAGSVLQVGGFGADGGTPATATLRGALLNAGTGSTLNLTGGFIQASGGGHVNVDPGVTTSLITLHGGSHTLGASAIGVFSGGQFTGGSASAALIGLDNAQLTGARSVLEANGVGAGGTPGTANLRGALLNAGPGSALNLTGGFIQAANGGQVNVDPSVTTSLITLHGGSHTLGASAIGAFSGGQFTGGSASAPLIDLDNAQLTGAGWVLEANGVGPGGTPGTANLRGALLNPVNGSTLRLNSGGFIQAASGGQVNVDPGVTTSLITLHGGSYTLGASAIGVFSGGQFTGGSASAALIDLDNAPLTGARSVLEANGVGAGGTPGTANLRGALLNAGPGSALNLTGGFIQAANGGQVNVDPSVTTSLITLHGGSHSLGPGAIGVSNGGQFTGGGASAPLIELDNAQLTGLDSVLQVGGVGADGVTLATATLRGALLNAGTGSPLSLTGGFIRATSGGQVIVAPGATTSVIPLHGGTHTLGGDAIGVFNGGQFTGGSPSAPLISLDNGAALSGASSVLRADGVGGATGGTPATATLAGALLNAASGSTLNLSGGFIQAANGGQVIADPGVTTSLITLHGGTHTLGPSAIGVSNGGQFTGGSASAALIELDNAQLTGLTSVLQVGGFGADGVTPATANLGGALLNAGTGSPLSLTGGVIQASSGGQVIVAPGATTSLITLHGGSHTLGPSAIGVSNGGQFTGGSASAALIGLDNSAELSGAGSVLRADGVGGATGVTPATANLRGALLNAGHGSTLNLTGGFIQASNDGQVIVDQGVTNSLITLRGGTHTLGSDAITVFNEGQFTAGGANAPVINLDNAQLRTSPLSPVSGDGRLLLVDGLFGGFGATRATLNGPLLNAANGSSLDLSKGFLEVSFDGAVTAHGSGLVTLHGGSHTLGSDAILIRNGGQFTGGGPSAALIDLDSASLTTSSGGMLTALFSGTILATAHLEGALLNAGPGSALNLTGGFIQVSTGGAVIVDPGVTNSLITLHGGTHTLGASAIGVFSGGLFGGGSASAALIDLDNAQLTGARSVLEVDGVGGAFRIDPSTAGLRGALLNAGNGSTLSLTGGFIQAANGGQVFVDQDVTNSLVTLQGGSHMIAAAVPTGSGPSMFDLSGRPAHVTIGTDGFVVSADQPLSQGGGRGAHLLETNGATIGQGTPSQRFLRLDSALLEASLPLLTVTNNSLIRTATDAIDLSVARLTILGDLVQLNASRFDVVSGALASVRNGSSLMVGGNLVTLMNGSTLNLLSGPVLNVSGNSRVDITGALIGFSGTPSTVNITNNLCEAGCATIGGLRVQLNGTPAGNVRISSPVTGSGAVNIPLNAAHLQVSGVGSRVTIGPP